MLDFKELSKDGQDLEQLVRELLFARGLRCYWSGKGPDGGRDLLAIEDRPSLIFNDSKRWLIQCKHNAHAGGSVGIGDLDDIVDSCAQHNAEGYLLVCSTQPSSTVVDRLEAITANQKNNILATYWDAVRIEQLLTTPRYWRIAQRFFPASSLASTLQVYATENPNHWVVNFKGYYFHLTNRIGSTGEHHLSSISQRISEIENIKLPKDHFIRVRSVYYDDKNGGYTWYVDYMHPHDQNKVISAAKIKHILGDGYALEDGHIYSFDVMSRSYLKHSDHYDPDHYDYYRPYIRDYLYGSERDHDFADYHEQSDAKDELERELVIHRNDSFEKLNTKISSLPFVRLVRSCNAQIEDLDKFNLLRDWSELIADLDFETDRFFSAWFLIKTDNETEFHKLISYFPQGIDRHFRLNKAYIYVPDSSGRSELDHEDGLYELTLSIHPAIVTNKFMGRKELNEYFLQITDSVSSFLGES